MIQKSLGDHDMPGMSVYEKRYFKQRKRTRLAIALVIILGVLLISGFFYIVSKDSQARKSPSGTAMQISKNVTVSKFFDANGNVDEEKVDRIKNRVPANYRPQMPAYITSKIDAAVSSGEITSAQGAALKQAFGVQ